LANAAHKKTTCLAALAPSFHNVGVLSIVATWEAATCADWSPPFRCWLHLASVRRSLYTRQLRDQVARLYRRDKASRSNPRRRHFSLGEWGNFLGKGWEVCGCDSWKRLN